MAIEAAAWGLFVAFVVHDAEEWFTLPGWGGRNANRLRRIYPRMSDRLLRRLDPSAVQVRLGITLIGVLVLLAAADGARTDGRSAIFQIVLIGFGVHALLHLGQAVLARGYTPGVVSAVLVVAPFSLWAWHQIAAAGAVGADAAGIAILAAVFAGPLIIAVNLAAAVLANWFRRT